MDVITLPFISASSFVFGRIYALREEITALKQGDTSVETYYGRLKTVWEVEEAPIDNKLCVLGAA